MPTLAIDRQTIANWLKPRINWLFDVRSNVEKVTVSFKQQDPDILALQDGVNDAIFILNRATANIDNLAASLIDLHEACKKEQFQVRELITNHTLGASTPIDGVPSDGTEIRHILGR